MRHGETLGFYIPAQKRSRKAELEAMRAAAKDLSEMIASWAVAEDELMEEYKKSGRPPVRKSGIPIKTLVVDPDILFQSAFVVPESAYAEAEERAPALDRQSVGTIYRWWNAHSRPRARKTPNSSSKTSGSNRGWDISVRLWRWRTRWHWWCLRFFPRESRTPNPAPIPCPQAKPPTLFGATPGAEDSTQLIDNTG
jgi:hypothetical protein